MGQHTSFHNLGPKRVWPISIALEIRPYVHMLIVAIWNREISVWIKTSREGANKTRRFELLSYRTWGIGGMYGTPHGDFSWKYDEHIKSGWSAR
jgi:hypothetical protein